ncbi:hypothetical protein ElyMa_000971900 [Elysia marginata]|uniref:Uncharacterized protein n=1 Tax=Elysia marginata TaxID=1093978 RepID=A0AAV4HFX5_9GAST|nr:hypothetical protein ElyMa_000971900 [Elysia marginata]
MVMMMMVMTMIGIVEDDIKVMTRMMMMVNIEIGMARVLMLVMKCGEDKEYNVFCAGDNGVLRKLINVVLKIIIVATFMVMISVRRIMMTLWMKTEVDKRKTLMT